MPFNCKGVEIDAENGQVIIGYWNENCSLIEGGGMTKLSILIDKNSFRIDE